MNTIGSYLPLSGLGPPVPASEIAMEKNADDQARDVAFSRAMGDFESIFTSMMLKELRKTNGEEGGLFSGDGSDTYGVMFDMFMGQHLATAGGIGCGAGSQWMCTAQVPMASITKRAATAGSGTGFRWPLRMREPR